MEISGLFFGMSGAGLPGGHIGLLNGISILGFWNIIN
jgi:hypothetical protein